MIKKTLVTTMVSALALAACDDGYDEALEAATADRGQGFGVHLVHEASNNPQTMRIALERGVTPTGTILVPYPSFNTDLIIMERTRLNGDCISKAREGLHPENNMPIVNFQFTVECAKLFGRLTSENIGRRFAIVMDGQVITAPNIRTAITGGAGFIEGGFTPESAEELAYILNRLSRMRDAAKD